MDFPLQSEQGELQVDAGKIDDPLGFNRLIQRTLDEVSRGDSSAHFFILWFPRPGIGIQHALIRKTKSYPGQGTRAAARTVIDPKW